VDARHRLSKVSQGSVISVICTRQATGHQDVCARDRLTRGAVLHAQRPSDSLCQRTLGLNPGLLRLRHWPSDALTTQLDLMQCVMLPCPMSGIVQTWMSQIIPYTLPVNARVRLSKVSQSLEIPVHARHRAIHLSQVQYTCPVSMPAASFYRT
jgi:hypothetical protein